MKEEKRFFNFYVDYVITSNLDNNLETGELPITMEGNSYEEARTKTLDFAQSISRCYNNSDFEVFYFRIINA